MNENLWYWMVERERIRMKREKGFPPPWTDDWILRTYHFCNVFREYDRVTQWIKENWRDPYMDHPNLAFAMAVARQINWPPTLEAIGFPEEWQPNRVQGIMEERKTRGDKIYTGAYMISGTLGGTKIEQTVWKVLTPLYENPVEVVPDSLEATWRQYLPRPGFSGFMAYEVVSDLRWTPLLAGAKDTRTFANAGPGARRGLNRFFGRPIKTRLSFDQMLEEMRFLLDISKDHLPDWFLPIELREIEHSLCEFDKYERTRLGEGRPRSKYRSRS